MGTMKKFKIIFDYDLILRRSTAIEILGEPICMDFSYLWNGLSWANTISVKMRRRVCFLILSPLKRM